MTYQVLRYRGYLFDNIFFLEGHKNVQVESESVSITNWPPGPGRNIYRSITLVKPSVLLCNRAVKR
jgi:hypothetical protein